MQKVDATDHPVKLHSPSRKAACLMGSAADAPLSAISRISSDAPSATRPDEEIQVNKWTVI